MAKISARASLPAMAVAESGELFSNGERFYGTTDTSIRDA